MGGLGLSQHLCPPIAGSSKVLCDPDIYGQIFEYTEKV